VYGDPVEKLVSRSPLLKPEQYRARFQAAQSAMHRSLLFLLALIAFWFAIEGQYAGFRSFHLSAERLADKEASRRLDRIHLQRLKDAVASAQAAVKRDQTDCAKEESGNDYSCRRFKFAKEEMESFKVKFDTKDTERKETITKAEQAATTLLDGSSTLAVTGTSIAVPTMLAPLAWLTALVIWCSYFARKRRSALEAAGAFIVAARHDDTAIEWGALGDGSLLLAPLPSAVTVFRHSPDACVAASELRHALGWPDGALAPALLSYAVLVLLVGSMARVLLVSLDVTGELLTQLTQRSEVVSFLAAALSIVLCVGISAFYTFWLTCNAVTETRRTIDRRRRNIFLATGAAGVTSLGMLFGFFHSRARVSASLGLAERLPDLVAGRLVPLRSPRFIPDAVKAKWQAQHQFVAKVGTAKQFVVSDRDPKRHHRYDVAVHYANAEGSVRLFCAAKSVQHMQPVDDDTIRLWIQTGWERGEDKQAPVAGAPAAIATYGLQPDAVVFEAAVLDRIEEGRLKEAISLLHMATRSTGSLRLLDLLAGCAIRHPESAPSIEDVVDILKQRYEFMGSLAVRRDDESHSDKDIKDAERIRKRIRERLVKWQDEHGPWYRRWSDHCRPIWWHHPLELREIGETGGPILGRTPTKPGARQRPVRIP
jgi:hypothetical protein